MGNQHLKTGENFTMNITKKQQGFTIIEVMIVLAIAGLIMVVALIAIPQLQRNQRNNARQSILSRMSTEISNFAGNNNGEIPVTGGSTSDDFTAGFNTRYLSNVDTNDPQTGDPMVLADGVVPSGTDALVSAVGTVHYAPSASCDGENVVSSSARQFALWTQLEGGAIYCLDNS